MRDRPLFRTIYFGDEFDFLGLFQFIKITWFGVLGLVFSLVFELGNATVDDVTKVSFFDEKIIFFLFKTYRWNNEIWSVHF